MYIPGPSVVRAAVQEAAGIEIDRGGQRGKRLSETSRKAVPKHQSSCDRNGQVPATMLRGQLLIVHCTVKYDTRVLERRDAKTFEIGG